MLKLRSSTPSDLASIISSVCATCVRTHSTALFMQAAIEESMANVRGGNS